MKHREDRDVLGILAEQHEVGETTDDRAPDGAIDAGIAARRSGDGGEGGVYAPEQIIAEPLALILVPISRRVQLRVGLCANPEREGHRRVRTCSRATLQGIAASGCAS